MRKTLIVLFLCVVMAGTIGATAVTTAAQQQLTTPRLVAPLNNAELTTSDVITHEWKAVRGAVNYLLDIQMENPRDKHDWISVCSITLDSTSVTLPGLQGLHGHFAWRVTALASDPALNSEPSPWSTYTVVKTKQQVTLTFTGGGYYAGYNAVPPGYAVHYLGLLIDKAGNPIQGKTISLYHQNGAPLVDDSGRTVTAMTTTNGTWDTGNIYLYTHPLSYDDFTHMKAHFAGDATYSEAWVSYT